MRLILVALVGTSKSMQAIGQEKRCKRRVKNSHPMYSSRADHQATAAMYMASDAEEEEAAEGAQAMQVLKSTVTQYNIERE